MSYWSHLPPAPLRPFVAQATGYRVPANPTGRHRGLPSRHLTLVVELTAPLRITSPAGQVAAHGIVGGLHTAPALIDASQPQDGIQYALTPLAGPALFGVPAVELAGAAVDLVDLLGARAGTLVDELREAPGWPQRFRLLDAALLRRLAGGAGALDVAAEVGRAWRLLFDSHGRIRVADVATEVGWSRRHLSERFRLATGLTPKQAARVARFEAARRLLTGPRPLSLAELAVHCGFVDQPHLAREWQAMAGCSVGTWLREELPFVHDAAVAQPAESAA